jgi:hypothetical protein
VNKCTTCWHLLPSDTYGQCDACLVFGAPASSLEQPDLDSGPFVIGLDAGAGNDDCSFAIYDPSNGDLVRVPNNVKFSNFRINLSEGATEDHKRHADKVVVEVNARLADPAFQYQQRREEIARRRNPNAGRTSWRWVQWFDDDDPRSVSIARANAAVDVQRNAALMDAGLRGHGGIDD